MTYPRYAVLSTPCTQARNLTSTECRRLRALGVSCSERWEIYPRGNSGVGDVYRPSRAAGCMVTADYSVCLA